MLLCCNISGGNKVVVVVEKHIEKAKGCTPPPPTPRERFCAPIIRQFSLSPLQWKELKSAPSTPAPPTKKILDSPLFAL
jgi:hypothetical protein